MVKNMKDKITSEIKNGVKIIHCEHKKEKDINLEDYKEIMRLISK